ncbi:putative membrane protein (TIGR04086 family) [Evansella vedderi]|uniref:Membrane protein (TIGR04086 family) n=1 Tax=Evansella vedderi TaxID=38282 RepID=A0ABT9ZSP8_9BACI|nr:TIGR04086 family membrane protein [Evansella vedderi]MDQ0254248.1 putative membrane protein (TIGR04086 family) [Evansella vedderi]
MMNQRLFSSALYGILTILVLVIVASLISSTILKFTSLQEGSFTWALLGFSFLAVLCGGFIAGGRSGQKGWLAGALTAVLYTFVIFLVQFLGFNEGFDLQQWLVHSGYVLAAMLGGIFGVNVRGESY